MLLEFVVFLSAGGQEMVPSTKFFLKAASNFWFQKLQQILPKNAIKD
jgi:hypothetical protein